MKKSLITISAFTLTLLTFTACGPTTTKISTEPATKENPQQASIPQKIDGLLVPACEELFADLEKNYQNLSSDELYKAASDILFSDGRLEEANLCCKNIVDAAAAQSCQR